MRVLIAALLIGLMSLTPLSAVLEPGRHVTMFPGNDHIVAVPVLLDDHTGIVSGIGLARPTMDDGVTNPAGNDRVLVVSWLGGSCDHHVWLLFERADRGYRLAMRTERPGGCVLGGIPRAVVL